MSLGKLYLVPNKLGESKSYNFPKHQQSTLISSTSSISFFENEKPGRAFIKKITS